MHPSAAAPSPGPGGPASAPETAEDALLSTMIAVGRQLRQRQPTDTVDYSAIPVLKLLTHLGPIRLSGLASELGLDASTVSRHARQLEDRGLVERAEDPDDGRASRIAISPHGRDCLGGMVAARRRLLGQALAGWDENDRETLRRLLGRLLTTLTQRADEPGQPRTTRYPGAPAGRTSQETTA